MNLIAVFHYVIYRAPLHKRMTIYLLIWIMQYQSYIYGGQIGRKKLVRLNYLLQEAFGYFTLLSVERDFMTEQPDEDAEDEIPETSDFVDEEKGKDEFTFETKEINSHSIHDFSNRTPSDTTAVFSIPLLLLSILLRLFIPPL